VFNRAWNEPGDESAADRFESGGVVEYLLRGPDEVPLKDRLRRLINPEDNVGMTGFRESLLTKVLCIVEPERFLPILIYSSEAGGKRQIAESVFGLSLPPAAKTSMTRGRLACWSGQVLVESDLIGKTVDPEEFGSACDAVATITDHFGPLIAKDFGGRTFFADQKAEDAAIAPEQKESTGLYL